MVQDKKELIKNEVKYKFPWLKISIILSCLVSVTVLAGFLSNYSEKFARAEDLHAVETAVKENTKCIQLLQKRIEQKIVTDRLLSLEERKARIESKEDLSRDDKLRIMEYERDIHQCEIDLKNLDESS